MSYIITAFIDLSSAATISMFYLCMSYKYSSQSEEMSYNLMTATGVWSNSSADGSVHEIGIGRMLILVQGFQTVSRWTPMRPQRVYMGSKEKY